LRKVKLTIRYDGSEFLGWQRQPGKRTVQGVLERAVVEVTQQRSAVHGSGRTDAGVHALGQVAHFATACQLPPDVLVRALNANLPADVAVYAAADVAAEFHARKSARRKTYVYQFAITADRHPLLRHHFHHLRTWPEVDAMRSVAARLVGRHDFRSFATEGHLLDDAVRHLMSLRVLCAKDRLRLFATGDGFLQHMVRTIAGLLLRVGTGRETSEGAMEILEARDRRRAPAALPANALFLWRVDY